MSNSFGANGSLRGQRANQTPTSSSTTRATESNQRSGRAGSGGGGGGASGNAQIAAQRKPAPARLESYASVESNWSGDIGKSPAISLLSSSSPESSPESVVTATAAAAARPRVVGGGATAKNNNNKITRSLPSGTSGATTAPRAQVSKTASQHHPHHTTSSTQRLSSIEILTENKQRQLQLEQQESFKQHLEQRQRYIQQQAHEQQGAGARQSDADAQDHHSFISAAYRVDTSAPEYVRMAQAAAAAAATAATAKKQSTIAVNPFNSEARTQSPKDDDDPSTVSGRSGFLATLMGASTGSEAATTTTTSKNVVDEELAQDEEDDEPSSQHQETRYTKVAQSNERSYNYDQAGAGSGLPFYRKDLGTLLADCRDSRRLVILIVAVALLLDNMLLTAVVPIIPAYLYKLRVEREHRQVLTSSSASSPVALNKSSPAGSRLASLDTNRNGRLDEEEIQAELERRINESISGLQDRFSGSFFHPRVLKNRPIKSRDEDDDDDENDEQDDDDDERPPRRKQKVARYPREALRSKVAAKSSSLDLDDEEYEPTTDDDDDDNERVAKKNGKNDREGEQKSAGSEGVQRKSSQRKVGSTSKPPASTTTTTTTSASVTAQNSQNDDDNDDDDDEDLEAIKKWNKLRKSLMTMAEMSGNDTDALAGMCLSMVMGRPGYFGGSGGGQEPVNKVNKSDGKRPRQRARQRGAKVERVRPPPVEQPEPEMETTTVATALVGDDEVIINHQDIVDESFEVGVMFASKPIVQALANPFVGAITNRVGFTLPMFLGFTIMFLSTLVFAFGSTYTTLFMARAIQGVGSACTSVAGMSMIADRFPDDAERGNAMAVALGGLALGVVIGPPFGGFMYEFFGKPSPFIVLAILALLDGLLQLLVLQPRVSKCQEEGASLLTLIKDPYILVAAGAITFANTGIGILEPALPLWMMDTMQAKNWEQGVAFLPAALSYLFSTNLFGNLGLRIGRWRSAMLGLVIIGLSLLLIPFASRVDHLILPNGAIGFAIGMVDSTMMPMLGYLVDIRHTSVYGSVYAIGDVAFCASFVFGPALSGTLVELIGFEGLIITTALICFAFAPLLILLKNPPARAINEAQMQEQSTLRYVNYNHLDSPDEEAAQQLTSGHTPHTAGSEPKPYHHYQQNEASTGTAKTYQAR